MGAEENKELDEDQKAGAHYYCDEDDEDEEEGKT